MQYVFIREDIMKIFDKVKILVSNPEYEKWHIQRNGGDHH